MRTLLELSKSGIVTLVLISVLGGFLAGHSFEASFPVQKFLFTLFGVLFLASGSSALNQVQEWKMDLKMPRTAKRPIPSGRMSVRIAGAIAATSLIIGGVFLYFTDLSVFVLGILAVISYNGFYTLWWKKHWPFAAIPGAIPGALPILMGYAAASGDWLAPGGIYLFFILFFWQMPHFWTLALRYSEDYQKGGVPTLPVALGETVTVQHIVLWSLGYIGLGFLAFFFFRVSWIYLGCMVVMSVLILKELRSFVQAPASKSWLRFFLWVNFSLIFILGSLVIDLWSIYLLVPLTR